MRLFLVLFLTIFLSGGLCLAKDLPRLHPPYDFPSPPENPRPDRMFACGKLSFAPPGDLIFSGIYDKDDPERDDVNKAAQLAYRTKTTPLTRFENELIDMANAYWAGGGTDAARASCALERLYAWASKDALLGTINDTGRVVRQWSLASLASAYIQIGREPSLDSTKRAAVETWLRRVVRAVMEDYPADSEVGRKKNNHLYWAAWAVTATGVALNDRPLYEWGMEKATQAIMKAIRGDGTLPLELERGAKAMHYHQFSVIPLVMIAETGLRNGTDLYAIRGGILHRLVKRVLAGFEDPSYFEKLTGVGQDGPESFNGGHLAWMEAYQARFPSSSTHPWLEKFRPMVLRRIGGNMTMLYNKN
ncbi:MAG: alginate lyase family protein [Alphaproteobacteria bacterium]|nr:alginate lyase family protein [Alphaproteobacteria bacterium]